SLTNVRQFLIVSVWNSKDSHKSFACNCFFPETQKELGIDDIEDISGSLFKLEDSWTVIENIVN
ncbi:hypothetical protein MJH12_03130, partial [bacterium]|nr:hypothetical protein [bacterium]